MRVARLRKSGLIRPERPTSCLFCWGDYLHDPLPWMVIEASRSGELVITTPNTKQVAPLAETRQPPGGARTRVRCPSCDRRCDFVFWGSQRIGYRVCQRVVGPTKRRAPVGRVRGRLIRLSMIPG
jgi:hypothetical protein